LTTGLAKSLKFAIFAFKTISLAAVVHIDSQRHNSSIGSTIYLDIEMIKAKDIIKFKPEFQDAGDQNIVWIAIEDEDGGRVRISSINSGMTFFFFLIVSVEMLDMSIQ